MCPGIGRVYYQADQEGVCSNNGECDPSIGMCISCQDPYFHGDKKACELKHCPASANGDVDDQCSGHGTCDLKRGECNCDYGWSGENCKFKNCPNSNGVLYSHTSSNACDGRGVCNPEPDAGTCSCMAPFFGPTCTSVKCPRECTGRGGCDETTGKCQCPADFWGSACEFLTCPNDCTAETNGECNRHSGECLCKDGYADSTCNIATRCPATRGEDFAVAEVNWYSIWDAPGWVTCPIGQSVYAIQRSSCQALDCLEASSCAAPCLGESDDAEKMEIRHCYHDLNVYFSMDKQGWSKCMADYYIGGFYRSGSSLYELQMFKCCSYKSSRWSRCGELNWATSFDSRARVEAPPHKFLTGLYRTHGHQLKNLDSGYACGWVRGY